VWDASWIVAQTAHSLRVREQQLVTEQAVHGIDALSEVDLHSLLAAGFDQSAVGVLREQPYPAQWRKKKPRRGVLPIQSERQRCDLVLTARPGELITDALTQARDVQADRIQAAGTLFEPLAASRPAPALIGIDPADAYWLEIKLVGQFCFSAGVPGPNTAYSSELVRGVRTDLAKLAADPDILHAGLLLILFTIDEATANNDLIAVVHRCLDRDIALRSPLRESFSVSDRIGNTLCSLCLLEPVKSAPELL
jgi:hypothetical protein